MPFQGYNQVNRRDVQKQTKEKFDAKLDDQPNIRAVIVNSTGSDVGDMEWRNAATRQVWIREVGTGNASWAYCYNITPDKLGLPVIVGHEIGSSIREVLRTDKEMMARTNTTGISYESPSLGDYQPGGRFNLWVESKMIQPLATYPDETGLTVNVVGGDYPYLGQRVTFAGQTSIDITQNPNPGEHYYAGLYLDAANTLQIVYGASVVIATAPPEPSWPAGAFRLSVVRMNDTQTSIALKVNTDILNDIFDRRMLWSDENATASGTDILKVRVFS